MSLKDLKQRIASVKQTQKITRAMKMVAAAKLKRTQIICEGARPFFKEFQCIMDASLTHSYALDAMPDLFKGNGSKGHLIIVISADRGLCGHYNGSILRTTRRVVQKITQEGESPYFIFLGKKVSDILHKHYTKQTLLCQNGWLDFLTSPLNMQKHLGVIVDCVMEAFHAKKIGKITLIDTYFKSVMTQVCRTRLLVPFDEKIPPVFPSAVSEKADDLYRFDGAQQLFVDSLPRTFLTYSLYEGLLESLTSEQGARMSAMDNATRNAGDMIKKLELSYNRLRQSAITNELIEIISGAQALNH
jgi:F-type H+-transporting ATPase subunit gamma